MISDYVVVSLLVLVVWLVLKRQRNLEYGEEKQYILRVKGYHEFS